VPLRTYCFIVYFNLQAFYVSDMNSNEHMIDLIARVYLVLNLNNLDVLVLQGWIQINAKERTLCLWITEVFQFGTENQKEWVQTLKSGWQSWFEQLRSLFLSVDQLLSK